jgi:hypothetical protein
MKIIGKLDSNYLHQTRVTFTNIEKNPEIAASLVEQGYDTTKIQEGLALHSEAENAFRLLVSKKQLRLAKGSEMWQSYKELVDEYMGIVKRLKVELFSDPVARAELGVDAPRTRTVGGFIEESNHFFTTAINNAVIAAKILPLGYTPEKMQAGLTRLQAYQALRSEFEKIVGELQKLVVEKDLAFKRLRRWMAALKAACEVAFADNLQTLEEIGLFVLNAPRRKQEDPQIPDAASDPQQDTTGETGTETGADTGTGTDSGSSS